MKRKCDREREGEKDEEGEREREREGKEGSLPGDVGMINVKLSERWRGETTAMEEESWPGAGKRI